MTVTPLRVRLHHVHPVVDYVPITVHKSNKSLSETFLFNCFIVKTIL